MPMGESETMQFLASGGEVSLFSKLLWIAQIALAASWKHLYRSADQNKWFIWFNCIFPTMMFYLKSLSLTCTHIKRYMLFHEITADLFDVKSTPLTKMIKDLFCGPHSSKKHVHAHAHTHVCIYDFLNMYFKTRIWFCICYGLVSDFLWIFHSCDEEPGRAGGWWSTAELLLCARVPDQLNEPSKDGVLCFAAGGCSAVKSPTFSAGDAWECCA